MKKLLYILSLGLVLSSCAADTQSSSDEAVMTTTTTAATTEAATTTKAESSAPVESSKPDDSSAPEPVEKMTITAEVLSYKPGFPGVLTFIYEDKEYSLPLYRSQFDHEHDHSNADNTDFTISERIINNKLGETVYAKMSVTKDLSEVLRCEVVETNMYTGKNVYNRRYCGDSPWVQDEKGKSHVDKDLLYTFKRTEGSLCEISNINETLELDLNDLEPRDKLNYPETIDAVTFECYRFKDGKMFLTSLTYDVNVFEVETENGKVWDLDYINDPVGDAIYGKTLFFFGVVQSVSGDGDKITFLLNDQKTLCTVPTYYNDGGELKEGMEIMVRLIADSSLFGSGGEHEFDYAVVFTDPEYYNQTGIDSGYAPRTNRIKFPDMAYADYRASRVHLKYTKVSDVEKQDKEG